ncbi:porin [Laribacter hongkongensis]|uniref:porin n=1 Tax=Laribacter hongkongensis TaxID=168471 RepID=UPI001EFE18B8|nr:porin [Laribacter hongkongensis]MCG9098362.1 porin [Laribacter hongkongensis]
MNKKLIAAALASAFIAPAVLADVQIYGVMNADVESVKATGATTAAADKKSTTRVTSNTSRIGFKGNEDLGNGLKAIWQVEQFVFLDGTNGTGTEASQDSMNRFATRNSFVGLDINNVGQLLLGQYDSAYKTLVKPVNPLGDGIADINVTTFSRGDARYKNSVHYYSPSWDGFKVGASYGFDESRPEVANSRVNSNVWALAASYDIAGFNVAAGYTRQNDPMVVGADGYPTNALSANSVSYWKAVAKYTIANTQIGAGYERKNQNGLTATGDYHQNTWTVGAIQQFGAFGLGLAYVNIGDQSNLDDSGANQWTVAGTYDLSKRTQAYAFYTRISNDDKTKINFANNPIAGGVGAGSNPTGFGLGLKHTF